MVWNGLNVWHLNENGVFNGFWCGKGHYMLF